MPILPLPWLQSPVGKTNTKEINTYADIALQIMAYVMNGKMKEMGRLIQGVCRSRFERCLSVSHMKRRRNAFQAEGGRIWAVTLGTKVFSFLGGTLFLTLSLDGQC